MRIGRRFILGLLIFALVVPTAIAAGGGGGGGGGRGGRTSGPDPNKAYKQGVELLREKKCSKAARKFRDVLKAVPRNAEANFLRGRALACDERFKSAVSSFKRAIKYDRELYAAYHHLGSALIERDKIDDAREQLDQLAEMQAECEPTCPRQLDQAHESLRKLLDGSEEDAEQSFRPELLENGQTIRLAYLGAVEQINAGEFGRAIEALKALTLEIGPEPDVLNYLGYAHRNIGRFDDSLAYYRQALALDPNHLGANEYLGELFVELGEIARAKEQLQKLSKLCAFGCAEYEDLKRRIETRVVATR